MEAVGKLRARTVGEKLLKKEKLLKSAKKLFSLYGYDITTIKMITEDAGLSPAAFYLYFNSKIEVYRTLNMLGMEILEKMMAEAVPAGQACCADRIRALAGAYAGFFREEREYYDIIAIVHLGQREFFVNREMAPQLEEGTKKVIAMVSSVIEKGIRTGEFRKVDPWKTAVALWGMIDGVLILEVKKSTGFLGVTVAELVDRLVDLVRSGLTVRSAG